MMKLKVGHIFKATPLLAQIINERRPLPLKGKYRVGRMHSILLPEFDRINAQRNAMIEAYGHKAMLTAKDAVTGEDVQTEAENFSVPTDKMAEFNAAWAEIANEEVEVLVEAIPLAQLDLGGGNGALEAFEFVALDDLVSMTD